MNYTVSMLNTTRRNIKLEIEKIVKRQPDGEFAPVDLSLEGVNRWRASMSLAPLAKLPSEEGGAS